MEVAEGACHESLPANNSTKADILGWSVLSGGWGAGLMAPGTSVGCLSQHITSVAHTSIPFSVYSAV